MAQTTKREVASSAGPDRGDSDRGTSKRLEKSFLPEEDALGRVTVAFTKYVGKRSWSFEWIGHKAL